LQRSKRHLLNSTEFVHTHISKKDLQSSLSDLCLCLPELPFVDIQQAGGNQAVIAYISTSVAFATFIAILLYHIDLQIKVSQFLKAFCCTRGNQLQDNEHEREILIADAGGRALNAPARPNYGSGGFREPLLDAQ